MIVTFISQCEKKALTRTRRVLDSFADRIGQNSWQTVITQEGLKAVKKLLRKTATKNTAVSCHWVRRRARSELVWVVGNAQKFNRQGLVPVNTTRRNLLYGDWENTWTQAASIQIVAVIAALLHDLGKASVGFQKKLKGKSANKGDPYRHEWISLRLFEAMIAGCQTDKDWLTRLAHFDNFTTENPDWLQQLHNDAEPRPKKTEKNKTTKPLGSFAALTESTNAQKKKNIGDFPPLAQLVAWLVVTHHRLPFGEHEYWKKNTREKLNQHGFTLNPPMSNFYQQIKPVNGWVKNQKACDEGQGNKTFWQFNALATSSPEWQKQIKRWANKALNHPPLMHQCEQWLIDPFLMHMARLCLMVGDHNYSSLPPKTDQSEKSKNDTHVTLYANTDRKTGDFKQRLDEHLIGVAEYTARFAKLLPQFSRELPAILHHAPFFRRTGHARFQWQNKAHDLVKKHQRLAQNNGFFGVNMASTGRGKTLGNARIMAALADPEKGTRFTIALGLRVLTLQTGQALREKLSLDDSSLAVLVGGSSNRRLFELNQEQNDAQTTATQRAASSNDAMDEKTLNGEFEQAGSESAEPLIEEWLDFDANPQLQAELGTVVADPKARELLFAPVVSCTVDHLMGATETLKGGRHIAPQLRLLSSDLVLDEPDDFDQADLPALSRLVYMAGLLGSRVLLSSATLTPDLVTGLFQSYQAGRKIWQQHNPTNDSGNDVNKVSSQISNKLSKNDSKNVSKKSVSGIACAWFDEFNQSVSTCVDTAAFEQQHQQFVTARVKKLAGEPLLRMASILPTGFSESTLPVVDPSALTAAAEKTDNIPYPSLANTLLQSACELHQHNHTRCEKTGKRVSVGLIRMANINPLVRVARALYQTELPGGETAAANTIETNDKKPQIHLVCYHARQLLMLRNRLENKLDRLLNRHEPQALFAQPEIATALAGSQVQHHIFIVLATPVAEVGRDHDYDWALVEPSSMRSIIQLAGRVRRHRTEKDQQHCNLLIWENNIKALKQGSNKGVGNVMFSRPGFEDKSHLLSTHDTSQLITAEQLARIDSVPRIQKPEQLKAKERLADLEHQVMKDLFRPEKPNGITTYWTRDRACKATAHLQRINPFRLSEQKQTEYVCFPDEDKDAGFRFRYSDSAWKDKTADDSVNSDVDFQPFIPPDTVVKPWLVTDTQTALDELAQQLGDDDTTAVAMRFATVMLDEYPDDLLPWCFHPWIGFWKER